MSNMKYLTLTACLSICMLSHSQRPGLECADILVEAYYSNANEKFDSFYGGTLKKFPVSINPEVLLGCDGADFVSLPEDSYVIVRFTDNYIVDYPGQDDIFISEAGCSKERAEVCVSTDGIDFVKLGVVDDCSTSSLDLKTINFKPAVRFIKVVGLDNRGFSPGFDVVSIKGMVNSSVDAYVDFSSIEELFVGNHDKISKKGHSRLRSVRSK